MNDVEKGDMMYSDDALKNIYQEAKGINENPLDSIHPGFSHLASVNERYTKLQLIGQGAMKDVYKCFDEKSKRYVALARLRPHLNEDYYDFFIHEAWLIASMNHPNIIKIYETDIDENGRPYFTMDLKGDHTLKDAIKIDRKLERLLEVFLKITHAISYAHSREVLHLDLKPENIQCDDFGEVLVCDWGIGKLYKDSVTMPENERASLMLAENRTLHGEIKGTPGYMSPEQFSRGVENDWRSDIFALGCILHFIITGSPPFRGSFEERKKSTLSGARISLRKTFPKLKIPKALDAITLKAISINPSDRYDSVSDLQEDVYRFLEGFPSVAEKPTIIRKAQKLIRRHKKAFVGGGIALLCVSLVAAYSFKSINTLKSKVDSQYQEHTNLNSELAQLQLEYEVFRNYDIEKKHTLGQKFVSIAKRQMENNLLVNPNETLEVSTRLLEQACKLEGKGHSGSNLLFYAHCVSFNFKEAVKYESHISWKFLSPLRDVAMRFSHYNFNQGSRPTLPQLKEILKALSMERFADNSYALFAMSYDCANRKGENILPHVFGDVLRIANQPVKKIISFYDPITDCLEIQSDMKLNFAEDKYGRTLLSLLKVKKLVISDPYLNFCKLDSASVQILDVSNSPNMIWDGVPTNIIGLRQIIVKRGSVSEEKLRQELNVGNQYEIVFSE